MKDRIEASNKEQELEIQRQKDKVDEMRARLEAKEKEQSNL